MIRHGSRSAAIVVLAIVFAQCGDHGRSSEAAEPSVSSAVSAPLERTPAPPPAADSPVDGIVLQLRHAGAAVPGALVYVLDPSTLDEQLREQLLGYGRRPSEREMQEHGASQRSDARGQALIVRPERRVIVTARSGNLFGATVLTSEHTSPAEFVMTNRGDFVVGVQDPSGASVAGIPIAVYAVPANGALARIVARGRSGPDGMCQMRRRGASYPAPSVEKLYAVIDALIHPREQLALDPETHSALPPRFVVPVTGRLVILCQTTEEPVMVTLRVVGEPREAGAIEPQVRAAVREGRLEVPLVGLGLRLEVDAEQRTSGLGAKLECNGPRSAGQEITVNLDLQPNVPVVVAHVRDANGVPLRNTRLSCRFDAMKENPRVETELQSQGSMTWTAATDGEGRLRLVPRAPLATERWTGVLRIRPLDERGRPSQIHSGELSFPWRVAIGVHEVGTVGLVEAPLMCGGVVRDGRDRPVPRASVRIFRKHVYRRDPSIRGPERISWRIVDGLSTQTDEQGEFELRGSSSEAELAVSVSASAFNQLDPQPFRRGATDLELVLERVSAVEGTVRLTDVVTADVVLARLATEKNGYPYHEVVQPNTSGAFYFDHVTPGPVDVAVRLIGEPGSGVQLEGLVVPRGDTAVDPRLYDVTFASGVRRVPFSVVDETGQPVHGAEVVVPHDEEGLWFEGVRVRAGRGVLVTSTPRLRVLAYAKGRRVTEVDDLQSGQEIVLRPPYTARFQLPAGLEVPADPYGVVVELQRVPRRDTDNNYYVVIRQGGGNMSGGTLFSAPWWNLPRGTVVNAALVEVAIAEAGSYRPRWSVRKSLGGGRWATVKLPVAESSGVVEVDESAPGLEVPAGIEVADVERALKSLRERKR